MRNKNWLILLLIFVFVCTGTIWADTEREPCPETGTSYDTLIQEAYDSHGKFLEADLSVGHGTTVLKELYNTAFEKTEEEAEKIMVMTDSAFTDMISQEETRQTFIDKLTEDSKATLDTLKTQLNESLKKIEVALESANEIVKEIPDAIKRLPSEFTGLKATKIPKIKSALEKAQGWAKEVIEKSPVDIEALNAVGGVVKELIGEE